MPIICPTILAEDEADLHQQVEKVAGFAHRLQFDLSDGSFAPTVTVKPEAIWWPAGVKADIHLMYNTPARAVKLLLEHRPHLIIVHAEADGNFELLASHCRQKKTKVGVALLQQTDARTILPALELIDHVLIFSGDLGSFGGRADLELLDKVKILKNHKPSLEIGWDGGIDDQNVSELILGGVDVLNVGGYIQKAEDSAAAFHKLDRIADETGTT